MFDTELYQQVLGLTAPWKVTDVRLDVESTEIHVHVDHPEGCRWNCPQCSRELACLGNPDPDDMKVYGPEGKETFDDDETPEEAPS